MSLILIDLSINRPTNEMKQGNTRFTVLKSEIVKLKSWFVRDSSELLKPEIVKLKSWFVRDSSELLKSEIVKLKSWFV